FAVVLVVRWRVRRRFAGATTVGLIDRRSRASFLRGLPFVVLAAALGFTGLALMDPGLPYSESEVSSGGLDICIVLDLSSSMQEPMERMRPALANAALATRNAPVPAKPPGKTRLEATKDAIKTFVRHRRDDRVALVVFSDNAYVISPLT